MKPMIWAWMAATAITGSAQAQSPYAADLLEAERVVEAPEQPVCPALDGLQSGQRVLSEAAASALLCHILREQPLARDVWEYGCTDRSELVIGALLEQGVHPAAIGRASTFYDTARNQGGGQQVFSLEDPAHDEAFYRAWQLVFGDDFKREITLLHGEQELVLDVDGTIQWNIGHIAPTLWVQTAQGAQLRVLDPVLGPDGLLSLEAWRARQQAQAAAVVWGALGHAPDILVEYTSGLMRGRLLRALHQPSHTEIDSQQVNVLLRETPQEMKAALYARVLQIDPDAPWHPLHWAGYSFTGDDLPDWNVQNPDVMQRRHAAASRRLEPLLLYQQMREKYTDDEAFLTAVRDRMLEETRQPKRVFIRFSNPY